MSPNHKAAWAFSFTFVILASVLILFNIIYGNKIPTTCITNGGSWVRASLTGDSYECIRSKP